MGNTPGSSKKHGVTSSSTTGSDSTARAPNNNTQSNNKNNNNGNNIRKTPIEESDDSDSASENYGFDNSQPFASDTLDANFSLTDMPNEILCLLIANLEAKNDIRSLMFTSKVFVELVYYSWSRLSMRYDNKLTYHQFLALPAERLKYLIELDISYCSKMTNALFAQIIEKTPNLQVLKMKGCKRLTRPSFNKIAQIFPRLTSLDMRYCNAEEIKYANDFPSNPNFKELGICPSLLSKFSHLDPLQLTYLNLKSQAVHNYVKLGLNMDEILKFSNLVTFKGRIKAESVLQNHLDFSTLKDLENLSLSSEVTTFKFAAPQKIKRLSFVPGNFDGTAFADLGNLISLKLKPRTHNNEGNIKNFTLAHFPKLEVLQSQISLKNSELIERSATLMKLDVPFIHSKEDVVAVILALPNLTSLIYHGMIDKNVFQALRSLKKLEHLQFSDVQSGVKKLNWKRFKRLRSIKIMNCSYDRSAEHLQQMKQIPKLEKLHIRSTDGTRLNLHNPQQLQKFCEYFEGFPSLKVLIMHDSNIMYYNEREEALMRIKGLTYVDCQRLQ